MNNQYFKDSRMNKRERRLFDRGIQQLAHNLFNTFGREILGNLDWQIGHWQYTLKNEWKKLVTLKEQNSKPISWQNPEYTSELYFDHYMNVVFNREDRRMISFRIYYLKTLRKYVFRLVSGSTLSVSPTSVEQVECVDSLDQVRLTSLLPPFAAEAVQDEATNGFDFSDEGFDWQDEATNGFDFGDDEDDEDDEDGGFYWQDEIKTW